MKKTLRAHIDSCYESGKANGYYDSKDDWRWTDEGLVYAIQDYLSCRELTSNDIDTLSEYGFSPEDFTKED